MLRMKRAPPLRFFPSEIKFNREGTSPDRDARWRRRRRRRRLGRGAAVSVAGVIGDLIGEAEAENGGRLVCLAGRASPAFSCTVGCPVSDAMRWDGRQGWTSLRQPRTRRGRTFQVSAVLLKLSRQALDLFFNCQVAVTFFWGSGFVFRLQPPARGMVVLTSAVISPTRNSVN